MKYTHILGLYVEYKWDYLYNYPIKYSYIQDDFGNLKLAKFNCKIINGELV